MGYRPHVRDVERLNPVAPSQRIGRSSASTEALANGTTHYVAPHGNDAHAGTEAAPWATLQKAADSVRPGDTVIVRDGVYTCDRDIKPWPADAGFLAVLKHSGTANAWITFRAEHKGGAKLDGQSNRCFTAFRFGTKGDEGSYVRFEGFEVYGFLEGVNLYNRLPGVHDVLIQNSDFHDLGRICRDGNNAFGIAIGGEHFARVTIDSNTIHDNGRLRPGERGCRLKTTSYTNHDHGIYLSAYDGLRITNNLIYNIREGWPIQLYSKGGANAYIAKNSFANKNPDRNGHILIGQEEKDAIIEENRFYHPGDYAIEFYEATPSNVRVRNNVTDAADIAFAVERNGQMTPHPSGVVISGNTVHASESQVNPL